MMVDETEPPSEEDQPEEPQGPVCGERLRDARRERQISVTEIAKELHLDEAKVRALEQNDFETLGAPVFAKGHLRKYAAIVGVDIDDVLADYYRLDRSVSAPPVITGRPKAESSRPLAAWIFAVIIIIAAILAWWLFGTGDSSNPGADGVDLPGDPAAAIAPPAAGTSPAAGSDAGVDEGPDDPDEHTDDDQDPAEQAPADATGGNLDTPPASTSADPVEPPPAAGEVRLSIRFTGDCWTEISDAGGRRLFFDLGRSGRTVTLSGEAPLAVLFGNADNVELSVNGAVYPIPAESRRGQTARLTIDRP